MAQKKHTGWERKKKRMIRNKLIRSQLDRESKTNDPQKPLG
ncbi:MAG: hypothetical protein V1899_11030 [Planctomycetota bacterium]